MKKQLFNILPILLCTVLSLKAYSQEDENFVRTIIPLIQTKTAVNSHTVSAHSAMVTTVYLDGLGRVKQQVLKSGSPTLEDLVTPVGYDKFGRQVKQYLPYPIAGTGNFREGAFLEQQEAYSSIYGAGQGMFASSEAQFEDSPLSRQLKQGAPGQAWQVTGEHAVETKYSARVTAGQVINFQVTEQPDPAKLRQIISRPVVNGMFWSTTSTDENNGTDREGIITTITNREGNTVLKKTWDGINFLYTYYLYDKLDRLAFVLPPAGYQEMVDRGNDVSLLNDDDFRSKWMFSYRYDGRGRVSAKWVPGDKRWRYIIYDKRDRPILVQDGELSVRKTVSGVSKSRWVFTKYDNYDRIVMTGIYHVDFNVHSLQKMVDTTTVFNESYVGNGEFQGYTNLAFPTDIKGKDLLTVTYYDNYKHYIPRDARSKSKFLTLKGYETGGKTQNLGDGSMLSHDIFYDYRYRNIGTYQENHIGGIDSKTTRYNNVDWPTANFEVHDTITTREFFAYDHVGRLMEHLHKINEEKIVVLSKNVYDRLGRIASETLGDGAQKTDYRYNLRGWLTHINGGANEMDDPNDIFGMQLHYDDLGEYNGNISKIDWKTVGGATSPITGTKQSYVYEYDPLSRLQNALYLGINSDDFNVSAIRYDPNGNITTLNRRKDGKFIDRLVYTYTGNQLMTVTDNTVDPNGFSEKVRTLFEYEYDLNGNMTKDKNKGIERIGYNHLNLPEMVEMGSEGKVEYTYDANGNKLRKKITDRNGVTVNDDYVHRAHYSNSKLLYLSHAKGRVVYQEGKPNYEYFIKDHLGNVRSVMKVNPTRILDIFRDDTSRKISHRYHTITVILFENAKKGQTLNFRIKVKNDRRGTEGLVRILNEDQKLIEKRGLTTDYKTIRFSVKVENDGEIMLELATKETSTSSAVHFDEILAWLAVDQSMEVVQTQDYFPFGGTFNSWSQSRSGGENLYKLTGNEEQKEWEVFDFNARMYDANLGRFNSIDPLADFNQESWNPYHFNFNNPLKFVDPTGLMPQGGQSLDGIINDLWNSTPEGGQSVWTNTGGNNGQTDCPDGNCNNGIDTSSGKTSVSGNLSTALNGLNANTPSIGKKRSNTDIGNALDNIQPGVDRTGDLGGFLVSIVETPLVATASELGLVGNAKNISRVAKARAIAQYGSGAVRGLRTVSGATGVAGLAIGAGVSTFNISTGNGQLSDLTDIGIMVGGAVVIGIVGTSAAPFVAAGGLIYGGVMLFGGEDAMNNSSLGKSVQELLDF